MDNTALVVGSINMDLVVSTEEIPGLGETVLGNSITENPGGKGANQGVAISKLGKRVNFLGMVGKDGLGHRALKSMEAAGVVVDHIKRIDGTTGIAIINVDKAGNNNIIVIPGANEKVDRNYLEENIDVFKASDIVIFQLEIPLESVKFGLELAKKLGKITVLNPAPAADLDDDILKNVDILIPNEHELKRISKMEVVDEGSSVKAARLLIEKGVKKVIVTLGANGVLYVDENQYKLFPSYNVEVVDTTAAGDSFIGGFVSSYMVEKNVEAAIERGQKTAALCIQRLGAQNAMPTRQEVEGFKRI
ncbi:MAG: ribokinase [Tissierellia bacterium]|nr:ribokinase [Tissierellia bacterium]